MTDSKGGIDIDGMEVRYATSAKDCRNPTSATSASYLLWRVSRSVDDIPLLIAEVRRLRQDIETERAGHIAAIGLLQDKEAEVRRLRKENDDGRHAPSGRNVMTENTEQLDLDAIEARMRGADIDQRWAHEEGWLWVDGCRAGDIPNPGLGAFIAATRTDIPALIAEVRRLREEASIEYAVDFPDPYGPEREGKADEHHARFSAEVYRRAGIDAVVVARSMGPWKPLA